MNNFIPFLVSLFLSHRLYKYAKINTLNQWVKLFYFARYLTGFLLVVEVIFSASNITQWIWDLFLLSLLLFAFKQKEMPPLRVLLIAFVPYILVLVLGDLTEIILNGFYIRYVGYFNNAKFLMIIWLIAILFSQHRQNKTAEKERLKRQKEDEINKAIAARKVELEALVTERTAEITKQKEELEHALHNLRATQDQLIQSEKMASLGELTAGIAHEIQNPLNFVNNFSEINAELIDELKQELEASNNKFAEEIANDIKENEHKITQHGKRAEMIVKSMLLHSRGNSGLKEPTDINALADEYLRLSYHGFRAKDKSFNADFKLEADATLKKINVVPQDIGRVLLNLVNNAFFAVSEKSKLQSSGYNPQVIVCIKQISSAEDVVSEVEISVKDNGPGIPDSVKEKIFQPFFTTKPTGQGTGLGLSLSYDIVKAHGGDIEVKSKENEETEFIITLKGN